MHQLQLVEKQSVTKLLWSVLLLSALLLVGVNSRLNDNPGDDFLFLLSITVFAIALIFTYFLQRSGNRFSSATVEFSDYPLKLDVPQEGVIRIHEALKIKDVVLVEFSRWACDQRGKPLHFAWGTQVRGDVHTAEGQTRIDFNFTIPVDADTVERSWSNFNYRWIMAIRCPEAKGKALAFSRSVDVVGQP